MAIGTVNTYSALLKDVYKGRAIPQLNESADPLYPRIERNGKYVAPFGGAKVVRAIRAGTSAGFGATGETGDLPTPPEGLSLRFESTLKPQYATISLSDMLIKSAGKGTVEAFVSVLDDAFNQMLIYAKKNLSRQIYGDGSGKLCKVSASMASAGNTFSVDNFYNLDMGMLVDIYAANGTSVATGREITNISETGAQTADITVDGTAFQAAQDAYLVVQGSKDHEITGLSAIVSTGNTLYNVNRATYSWLNSIVKTETGALSDSVIQENIAKVKRKGGTVDYLACSQDVLVLYAKYLDLSKRNVNTMELRGGFSGISYTSNGRQIPIVDSLYLSSGTMLGLTLDEYTLQEVGDWDYLTQAGEVLYQLANKPVYTATLAKYCELLCDVPGKQLIMTGITSGT